jgi:vacuolar protein sorting-associated protein 13A/C
VDKKDLSISVSSGLIKLNNVEVKPSAFDDLRLPITVKSGMVGSIEIQLSWTKLTSSPIVVVVKDVFVVTCANTNKPEVGLEEEGKCLEEKGKRDEESREERRNMLREEMEQHKIELLSNDTNDGTDAGMANKILNNLKLSIQNVHVRYEQEAGECAKNPVTLGVRLEKFSITSTNAQREPIEFTNNLDVVFKKAELGKLRVYIHNLPPALSQWTDDDDEDTLILKSVTATAWLTLVNRGAVKMKKPKVELGLECGPLNFVVSKSAVFNIIDVVNTAAMNTARAPFFALRPKVGSYKGHYKEWWRYAYGRALDLVRLKRKQTSMSHVRRCISVAVRYSKLYKRALGVLPLKALSKEEMDEFTVIQDTEPLAFLRLVREQANSVMRAQVQELLVEAALTPQPKKGKMASLFGSSKKVFKVTVGGAEVELTDEQLQMIKDLATSVAEEASEAAKDLEVSPKEYLESKPVTLNLVP